MPLHRSSMLKGGVSWLIIHNQWWSHHLNAELFCGPESSWPSLSAFFPFKTGRSSLPSFLRCGRTNVDAILRPDRHSNGPDAPSVPFEIYQHPSSFPLPDGLEFEFRQFGAPQSAPDQQLQNYGRRSGKAMVDGLGGGMVGFNR